MGMQSRGLQHTWLGVLLAVVGGLFCHGLYFLLKRYLVRQVCGRLFRGRRKNRHGGEKEDARSLSDGDVAEISVKLVSLAVALLCSTVGVFILWETKHDVLHSTCSIIPPYVYLIAWYFVYDLYAMFESYCLRKDLLGVRLLARVWIFTRQKWPFVLHHAAILVGLPIGINADLRLGLGDFYIGCFLIREFSTPFLQTAQILKLLDLHRTVFYKVNGVFLLVTFFIVRLLNTPLSFLAYAAQYHSWDVVAAVKAMKPICHTCLILEYALQVYWYSAIVKLAHSAVKQPKMTKLE